MAACYGNQVNAEDLDAADYLLVKSKIGRGKTSFWFLRNALNRLPPSLSKATFFARGAVAAKSSYSIRRPMAAFNFAKIAVSLYNIVLV